MPSLSEVSSESAILDDKELGDFYVMVSNLQRQIREFLKEKLGTSWEDRIENELPKVRESWREQRNKELIISCAQTEVCLFWNAFPSSKNPTETHGHVTIVLSGAAQHA